MARSADFVAKVWFKHSQVADLWNLFTIYTNCKLHCVCSSGSFVVSTTSKGTRVHVYHMRVTVERNAIDHATIDVYIIHTCPVPYAEQTFPPCGPKFQEGIDFTRFVLTLKSPPSIDTPWEALLCASRHHEVMSSTDVLAGYAGDGSCNAQHFPASSPIQRQASERVSKSE